MAKIVALIDGEHYPAVTKSGLDELGKVHEVIGAAFIGGTEKIGSDKDLAVLGVPIVRDSDYLKCIELAIEQFKPDELIDLSDEPVLGYHERFAIASLAMAKGVAYSGSDFRFSSPAMAAPLKKPSISVVGTGKRIGKTAIGGYTARVLNRQFTPIMVTQGRGGPAEPELIAGTKMDITPEYLMSVSKQGKHASSDHYEDALTSRVTTIGSRRCGGGMSGQTYFSNVDKAGALADQLEGDIVIFEGSGCTIPSVPTEGSILVIGAHQPVDYISSYLGPYRVRRSDIIVLTMSEPPMADEAKVKEMVSVIKALNPSAKVFRTIFRPRPLGNLKGKKVAVCLTAPKKTAGIITEYLEKNFGCTVTGVSCNLSKRPVLREEIEGFLEASPDVILTELKAAAVDVVTAWALGKNLEVVYMDNEPITMEEGQGLDEAIIELAKKCIRKKADH